MIDSSSVGFNLLICEHQISCYTMLQRIAHRALNRISNGKLELISFEDKKKYYSLLENNVEVDYKQYPYLPHQDPGSPEYVHSELDEYHEETEVRAYNEIVKNFQEDLKVQKQVWNSIINLDRPYKQGIKGVDTNLSEEGPLQHEFEDLGFSRNDRMLDVGIASNEDSFIANTPFYPRQEKLSNVREWEQERLNRPVTRNFNGKGYKYDVALRPEEKYEYVADRLGHPEFLGSPVDRLFRLENDLYHPTYLDQPFVQRPSFKPAASLNFEQGEVLYENTRVLEWIKLLQLGTLTAGGFLTIFVPFHLGFKTNLTTSAADELVFLPQHLVSPTSADLLRVSIPMGAGVIAYTVYILLNFTNAITSQYIVKMTYSKDKELVFVKRVDLHGKVYEEVYEMAHLEILPPNQRTGVSCLSSQDQDGLWRVTCMNTQKTMLLYNDHNHWNYQLRDEFFSRTLGMWDKSYYGFNRAEQQEIDRRWREQADHGFSQEKLPE